MFGFDDPEYLRDQLQQAQAAAYESEEQHAREVKQLTEQRDDARKHNAMQADVIVAYQRGVDLFNRKYSEWKAEREAFEKALADREWLADYFEQALADTDARLELAKRTTVQCANVAERACTQLVAQKPVIDCARALAFEVRESRMMNLRDLRHEIEKLDKVRPS